MCYFVALSPDITLKPRGHVDDRKGCAANVDYTALLTRQRFRVSLLALTRCFCASTIGMRESPAVFFSDSYHQSNSVGLSQDTLIFPHTTD